nr:uncharacterized protein LOC121114914 [Lepeophtheirus salmonis]
MVYIYVCKRFKVLMDMVSGRDGEWVNKVLDFYCKHHKINGKLERAEINPKKRWTAISYDSSTDVFKINVVYKESKSGLEHELKWLIKITRSDMSPVANPLLLHERQVYGRLMGDLINTIKQTAAGRLEGSRIEYQELIHCPDFVFEEIIRQTDNVTTNLLVIDNLEEKSYFPSFKHGPLNLCHLRAAIRTIAKFHAVGIAYKRAMFSSFTTQKAAAQAMRKMDDIEIEGENRVRTGRDGLFARFPFLSQRIHTMSYLIENRNHFLDRFKFFLILYASEEPHLVDIFEYIRLSTDQLLRLDENVDSPDHKDHPLDSIALGVLEARSFLFRYEEDENKENEKRKNSVKIQRSQSERSKNRKTYENQSATKQQHHHQNSPHKINLLKSVFGGTKDDQKVSITLRKKTSAPVERDLNIPPKSAALINSKYVSYTRITRDIAILFFTSADTIIRRFYLVKCIETYVETLGIALGQLGVDTDKIGMNYTGVMLDIQHQLLYGFLVGVLVAMANTNPADLKRKEENSSINESEKIYIPLTKDRIEFLLDLMRDIAAYVESKDFELGLLITNFGRYHELWAMMDPERYEDDFDDELTEYEEFVETDEE